MNRIGERIRKKRELMDMHLTELAERVDISPSALSQIEKSKSFPSIATLKSIADALHTTIGDLVGENETMSFRPVILKNDMVYLEQNPTGTIVFLLSDHDQGKQMDTFLLRFARSSGIDGLFRGRNGQVFCHVLSGEIRFDLGNKSYMLKQGDNIYFSTKTTFNAINNSEGISEMLWVQSPPGN